MNLKAERIVGSDYHLAEKNDNGALQHTRRPGIYNDNAFTQHASCEGDSDNNSGFEVYIITIIVLPCTSVQ